MNKGREQLFQRMSDGLLRRAFGGSFLHRLFRAGNSKSDLIATFDLISFSQQQEVDLIHSDASIGVVIQGPVVKKNTLAFCKFIQATYPKVNVVLSTWVGEDLSEFTGNVNSNFRIIQSTKPEFAGPSNINMQIVTSRAGIELLENLGCSYILKTRTDVFLTNANFLNYLTWAKSKGKSHAIVFSSFNSFLFRLFSVSDQVMFGKTDDISKFWNLNLVNRENSIIVPEIYLFGEYLKTFGFHPEENLTSYLSALADYAVIADHEQLGQIWNKGSFTALNYRWRGNSFPNSMSPLSYWLWELTTKDDSYIQNLRKDLT